MSDAERRGAYLNMLISELAEARKLRRRARVAAIRRELSRVASEAKSGRWVTA